MEQNINKSNLITFISKKQVQAEPMSEYQAVELGYARPNKDNHEWRQGYHIIYPDGYHSWCPLSEFMKSYKPAETVLERLTIEFEDLHVRLHKLEEFRSTSRYLELPDPQRELLFAQWALMDAYHSILIRRIEFLTGDILPDLGNTQCAANPYCGIANVDGECSNPENCKCEE